MAYEPGGKDYWDLFNDLKTAIAGLNSSINALQVNITSIDPTSDINSVKTLMIAHQAALIAAMSSINPNPLKKLTIANKFSVNPAAGVELKVFSANPNAAGRSIYNNSTNSMYGGPGAGVSGGNQHFQLGSNAGVDAYKDWFGPSMWTGDVYVRRNSGTGVIVGFEFE